MKKILFSLALSMIMFPVFSQMSSGNLLLGGNLNFSSEGYKTKTGSVTVNGPKTSSFAIIPQAAYFVSDNLAAGIHIGFTKTSEKTKVDSINFESIESTSQFHIGPFARYYYKPLDNAGMFIEGGMYMGFGKEKDETTVLNVTTTTEHSISNVNIGITPGLFFMTTERLGVEATFGWFGYSIFKRKNGSTYSSHDFTLSLNPGTFTFGVFYIL